MLLNVARTGVVYKAAFYLGVASCTVGVSSCTGSHAVGTDLDGSYQLDNGLTVVLRPLPQSDRAAVVVLFNLGNVHDPVGQSGRAHLLEHLYATSATATSAARDMNQLVQRYGGQFNMQTGYDYTVIAGVVGADTVEEELKDAAGRMTGLTISEGDLEREIPRILLELGNMYGGIPALAGVNHVRNRLNAIPSGGRYGGADDHLEAMSVDELQDVWRVYYKPNNATLAVAGGFDVAEVRDAIDRHFGPIPAGGTVEIPSAMWRQNVYGLAFSTVRRLQLGIDGEELRIAIEETGNADMRRLARSVFAPSGRVAVVIEPLE